MAKQTINIGAAPNDGTGTPLRTSFDYTNQNFTELYTALGGGVGLPGATTQVIFNDGGTNLAGDAGLTYNKTTDALTVVGALSGSKLTVTGGTIPANGVYLPAANTLEFAANSLAQYRIAPLGVFSWYDGAGGTRMTLNSIGLGIGATLVTGAGSLQFPVGTQIGCQSDNFVFGSNSKYDSGWKYVTAGKAALQYLQINGQHLWFNSAVGAAANDPITLNQAMWIDVGGNLIVGALGNNANGGVLQLKSGITFPATQVAATDVNTLDDYEEGTFTPTIVGGTTAGVGVYSIQNGNYTKVGNLVTFRLYVNTSSHTGTGATLIYGLPFTSKNSGDQLYSTSITVISGLTMTALNYPTAYILNNVTYINVAQAPVGGGSLSAVPISQTPYIIISGTYMV